MSKLASTQGCKDTSTNVSNKHSALHKQRGEQKIHDHLNKFRRNLTESKIQS